MAADDKVTLIKGKETISVAAGEVSYLGSLGWKRADGAETPPAKAPARRKAPAKKTAKADDKTPDTGADDATTEQVDGDTQDDGADTSTDA